MNIFTHFFKNSSNTAEKRKQQIINDLIRRESVINQDIFGKLPKGTKRNFFCLDKNTWVWYEEWIDNNKRKQQSTTKYIIRSSEILKSQNGGAYHRLNFEEAENFQKATNLYVDNVKKELYATRG